MWDIRHLKIRILNDTKYSHQVTYFFVLKCFYSRSLAEIMISWSKTLSVISDISNNNLRPSMAKASPFRGFTWRCRLALIKSTNLFCQLNKTKQRETMVKVVIPASIHPLALWFCSAHHELWFVGEALEQNRSTKANWICQKKSGECFPIEATCAGLQSPILTKPFHARFIQSSAFSPSTHPPL